MELIRTVPFEHKKLDYQVGVFRDGARLVVRALQNHQPVNGYTYHVDLSTLSDALVMTNEDLLKHLITTAMEDVREGRWEEWVKFKTQGNQ